MRPDLASLALFIRVAETRSITKAAEASFLALAAASRRIAQLEEQCGVELFYRTARGVELTPAGTAMLFHAKQVMGQIDQMRAELSDYVKGVKGLVRVQANTSALAQFLAEELAAFSAAYPAVKISLEEQRSAAIAQALLTGGTEVGIVVEGIQTEGLTCYEYHTDQLVAVVPKKHPLKGRQVAFVKLLDYDFVGLEGTTVLSQKLAESAAAADKPLRLRVQVKSFDVVAKMIQAGLGIGVLPANAARSFASALSLRLIPLSDDWATRRMMVCVRNYAALPLPARQLVDHLVPNVVR